MKQKEKRIRGKIVGIFRRWFGEEERPEQMPDIEYIPEFVIKYNPEELIARRIVWILLLVIAVSSITKNFIAVCGIVLVMLAGMGVSLQHRYFVTPDHIVVRPSRLFLRKEVFWEDMIGLRIVETRKTSSVRLILYDKMKLRVLDLSTPMENLWYLVKMAEHKNIEIRKEKNISELELMRFE